MYLFENLSTAVYKEMQSKGFQVFLGKRLQVFKIKKNTSTVITETANYLDYIK